MRSGRSTAAATRIATLASALVCLAGSATGAPFVFTATHNLGTARSGHTAILLQDGKVLVAGGFDPSASSYRSSTELFDPANGTWSLMGQLNTPRADHTATLLQNGKVLVCGGRNGNGVVASAELYDPLTGTWTATGQGMNVPRERHTATLLPGGQVLVTGGANDSSALASAELYYPDTDGWSQLQSMNTARYSHTANLLSSGKLLVAGGFTSIGDAKSATNSTELFDPANGTWTTALVGMHSARGAHTATSLTNGTMLVTGGIDNTGSTVSTSETYDPNTGLWMISGSLNAARSSHSATLLPNGKVLVSGGSNGSSSITTAELYDAANRSWSTTGNLGHARSSHTATMLPSGDVLVSGGYDSSANVAVAASEIYDAANPAWTATGSMSSVRSYHTATPLLNGKVLVCGGIDDVANGGSGTVLASAEVYDPANHAWDSTAPLVHPRSGHTATLLPNGKVLATGGVAQNRTLLGSAELYDPTNGTWTEMGSLNNPRTGHTATLLPNGKVLVCGGGFATAELFDQSTGTWTLTANLLEPVLGNTATLLPDGKLLVSGGANQSSGPLSKAELYNPALRQWIATGSMRSARQSHTATLLPDGRVLVCGGFRHPFAPHSPDETLSEAELYNPGTGTWSDTTSMNRPRGGHRAALLSSGKVLISGGDVTEFYGAFNPGGELYDPATRTWTLPSGGSGFRAGDTATLLADSDVLISGGIKTSTAELYSPGLGFASPSQPQIATAPTIVASGSEIALTGSRFRGVSPGSSGNVQDSATSYPVVQLRAIDSERISFLRVDPNAGWSDNSFKSVQVTRFPAGPALVTVFALGVPSVSRPLNVTIAQPTLTTMASAGAPVGGKISDTVTISGGSFPDGTVTFALYGPDDNTCGGTPVITSTVAVNGDGNYASAELAPQAAGTYRWIATYNGDIDNAAASGACSDANESVVVTPGPSPTPTTPPACQLLNLSTRSYVGTDNHVLIGGFIVTGTSSKKVMIRGLGPSLPVGGRLSDPVLELHSSSSRTPLALNDDWKDTQEAEISATGIPPQNESESAMVYSLSAKPLSSGGAAYSAILAGKSGDTGIGLLEIYDLAQGVSSELANISTRGLVRMGDDALIGGFIPGPASHGPIKVLIRALGPSLVSAGVSNALSDPVLELHNAHGTMIQSNNDWKETQRVEIEATKIPPTDDRESAMIATVAPATNGYTAVLRGANGATGIALVEIYALSQ
jgi:N-acetylneuraminic acid mutarotase